MIDTISWALGSFPAKIVLAVLFYLVLPRLLAALPQKPQFAAKYLVFLFSCMLMSAVGIFVSLVCTILGKRHLTNALAARGLAYFAAGPLGIKFNIKGEEKLDGTPAVFVCNHLSNVDIIAIGKIYPTHCAIMAKKELMFVPFLGLFMRLSNVIFIDRKNHKKALESTTHAVAEMKKHNTGIFVFPEGTRSHMETPDMLPFKKGAFHLAIQSQYPIIPIVIEGYSHVYSSKRKAFPGGEIEVRILDPISTTGLTADNLDEIMERTRSVMLKNLKEMDKSSSSRPATKPIASLEETEKLASPIEGKEALNKVDENVYHEGFKKRRTGL
ncbi:MAG: hypothetical protein J3Q66DRAFT_344101 [Benniella sp.]|nr:MAG: hypothetical protein J3Q66DRAFT_344101 [Benniella sp.]